jgi:hypothetical protein
MRWKQQWGFTQSHRNVAMSTVVIVSATMLTMATKSLEAQSLRTEREKMPKEVEAMVEEKVGQQVDMIIALGPNGQEHTLLTREHFGNPDDPQTVILPERLVESPKRVTRFADCQTRFIPGVGTVFVPGHRPADQPDGACP